MKLSEFDYNLPDFLIADQPVSKRDESKLLVLHRDSGEIDHKHFFDVLEFLRSGDVLVVNQSKVFPARLLGHKSTGGKVEILLEHETDDGLWRGIGKGVETGNQINFTGSDLAGEIVKKNDQEILIQFNKSGSDLLEDIAKIGTTPIPPYIEKRRASDPNFHAIDDRECYQTVYANESGSCAAPTAGLHFTDDLLSKIKAKGVTVVALTLHVGLGTFKPVETDKVEDHLMHSEYFSISADVLNKIFVTKKSGGRVVAVGTTTTRVLEHVFKSLKPNTENIKQSGSISGWTNIFIYPGFKFKCVDALITNFHLPKSTLLLLVSAFAGTENIKFAYDEAIKNKYRFYSYGDAMLIV